MTQPPQECITPFERLAGKPSKHSVHVFELDAPEHILQLFIGHFEQTDLSVAWHQ